MSTCGRAMRREKHDQNTQEAGGGQGLFVVEVGKWNEEPSDFQKKKNGIQNFHDKFQDRCFMAQREMWHYHAAENRFERFISGVFGFVQQIRIRFLSLRKIFLMIRILWCVRGSITRNETVHVHVLWPVCTHNSLSNVVVSLMIHDNIYLFIDLHLCTCTCK